MADSYPSPSFDLCDCDMLETGPDYPCACGEHNARPYRDTVLHWKGAHWRIECAFFEAVEENERLRGAISSYVDLSWLEDER